MNEYTGRAFHFIDVPWESSTLVIILIILPHLSFLHCQFQVFFDFLTRVYLRTQFDPLFLHVSWFWPRVVSNWMCNWGWPWIYDLPDSTFQLLGLKAYARKPAFLYCFCFETRSHYRARMLLFTSCLCLPSLGLQVDATMSGSLYLILDAHTLLT